MVVPARLKYLDRRGKGDGEGERRRWRKVNLCAEPYAVRPQEITSQSDEK